MGLSHPTVVLQTSLCNDSWPSLFRSGMAAPTNSSGVETAEREHSHHVHRNRLHAPRYPAVRRVPWRAKRQKNGLSAFHWVIFPGSWVEESESASGAPLGNAVCRRSKVAANGRLRFHLRFAAFGSYLVQGQDHASRRPTRMDAAGERLSRTVNFRVGEKDGGL